MTKDRFVEILVEEGYSQNEAVEIWNDKPYPDDAIELDDEPRIRRTARATRRTL